MTSLNNGLLMDKIKKVKKEFYQWRYWSTIIKSIRKQNRNKDKYNNLIKPYQNKPGIAFSFDDGFRAHHWYKYGKELFGFYDVKATFNINAFHQFEGIRELTQHEIDLLLELQANGHEIAHHGFRHQNAKEYSEKFGLNRWIDDEIIPLIDWMEKQSHSRTKEKFKPPVTFALPYSEFNIEDLGEVVPQYFKVIRGSTFSNNFTPYNYTGFAPSICIDSVYLSNVRYIKKIMKIAKQVGCNIIFMCHSILPDEVNWGDFGWGEDTAGAGWWRISPTTIKRIINDAKELDMEFYTTSEIAGVATFIDRNLEKAVREIIDNRSEKWILIAELSKIKELDLSNKNITNLDGIQYFINLERLNLSNNQIYDFRLLDKLKHIKNLDISNNHHLEMVN